MTERVSSANPDEEPDTVSVVELMPGDNGTNGENEAAERWAREAMRLRELVGELLGVVTRAGGYMDVKDQNVLFRARRALTEWAE